MLVAELAVMDTTQPLVLQESQGPAACGATQRPHKGSLGHAAPGAGTAAAAIARAVNWLVGVSQAAGLYRVGSRTGSGSPSFLGSSLSLTTDMGTILGRYFSFPGFNIQSHKLAGS